MSLGIARVVHEIGLGSWRVRPAGRGQEPRAWAVRHALVEAGHSVLWRPGLRAWLQELLGAKRDLDLPRGLTMGQRYGARLIVGTGGRCRTALGLTLVQVGGFISF